MLLVCSWFLDTDLQLDVDEDLSRSDLIWSHKSAARIDGVGDAMIKWERIH